MAVETQQVLSQQQINFFQDKGYLVADFGFDPDRLDRIIEKVHPLYDAGYHQDSTIPARVQDAWKQVEEVRLLARDPKVAAGLHQLMGRKPLAFQTLNFPIGTRQLPHSDTVHFNSVPNGYMVGVWVALQDITMDNGPLIYYPGSHKLPEYSMQDFNLDIGYEYYKDYETRIQRVIKDNGFEPEYGTIKKGEALIWHANLLHGGAPQQDTSLSRHSQVTHFFFEGCKYYTPMNSKNGKLAFRRPEWIPLTYRNTVLHNFLRRLQAKLRSYY